MGRITLEQVFVRKNVAKKRAGKPQKIRIYKKPSNSPLCMNLTLVVLHARFDGCVDSVHLAHVQLVVLLHIL